MNSATQHQSPDRLSRIKDRWNRTCAALRHGFNSQKHWIILFIILLTGLSLLVQPHSPNPAVDWWSGWDVVISFTTLVIAMLVWFAEQNRNWEFSLPKRLTAKFIFQNDLVVVCKNGTLSHEGDIRAFAQQLGAQAIGTKFLKFHGDFEIERPAFVRDRSQWTLEYTIAFTLSEMPSEFERKLKHVLVVDAKNHDDQRGEWIRFEDYFSIVL